MSGFSAAALRPVAAQGKNSTLARRVGICAPATSESVLRCREPNDDVAGVLIDRPNAPTLDDDSRGVRQHCKAIPVPVRAPSPDTHQARLD